MSKVYLGKTAISIKDARFTDSGNVLHKCKELVLNGVRIWPSVTVFTVGQFVDCTYWSQAGGFANVHYSTNKGSASTTATMSYTITGTTTYGIYVISDGEASYDYVSISITDKNGASVYTYSCKANEYGEMVKVDKLNDLDTYNVIICYTKDGSTDKYTDRGYVMLHARYKDSSNDVTLGSSIIKNAYAALNKVKDFTISASGTEVSAEGGAVSFSSSSAINGMGESKLVKYEITDGAADGVVLNGSLLAFAKNEVALSREVTVRAKAEVEYWPNSTKAASTLTTYSNTISVTQKAGDKKYKVTFYPNVSGATCTTKTIEVVAGSTISDLPVAELDGHTFFAWWTSSTFQGSGSQFTSSTVINSDMAVYALFEKNICTLFSATPTSIILDGDASSASVTVSSKYKKKIVDSGSGYEIPTTFDGGWSVADLRLMDWLSLSPKISSSSGTCTVSATRNTSGSSRSTELSFTCTEDVTKSVSVSVEQAIYKQPYKMVFNANGGSGSVPSDIIFDGYDEGKNITSTCPTKSGNYAFRGWSNTKSYSSTRIAYSTAYGGGTDKNGVKAQTTSAGWSFRDYFEHFGLSESDLPESGGYKVLTLYAQWEDTTCLVHIEPASGHSDKFMALNINDSTASTTRDLSLVMGDSLKMQALASKGYRFDYFKIGSNTYPVNPLTITVNNNINVYMYGKNQQYRITFDANGGSGSVPADIVLDGLSGKSDITNTKPTRSGYKFIGWSKGASVTSPRISYVSISSNDYGSSIGTASWTIETYLSNLEASYDSLVNSGEEKVLTLYAQWEAESAATYTATLSGSNIAAYQISTNGSSFSGCSNTMPITSGKSYWFKAIPQSGYEVVSYTIRYGTPTSSGTTFSGDTAEIYASNNIYVTFTAQATSSVGGGSTGQSCTVDLNGEWQYVSTITDSGGTSYKMYKSLTTAHSGISKMKVTWQNNSSFKVKLWSDSEASSGTSISTSSYDYAIALNAETAVSSSFDPYSNKSDIKAHTKGIGSGAGAPSSSNSSNWLEADYSGTSDGYAWILYRKDSSISTGGDCGYLMIPASANITN